MESAIGVCLCVVESSVLFRVNNGPELKMEQVWDWFRSVDVKTLFTEQGNSCEKE